MTEYEIFRESPIVNDGFCYEYAEYTRSEGRYPNERYFTNIQPLYVGKLIRIETGGWGDDGRWRKDHFEDNYGKEHVVNYSYGGRTCFRRVACIPNDKQNLNDTFVNVTATGLNNDNFANTSQNKVLSNPDLMRYTGDFLGKKKDKGGKRRKTTRKTRRNKRKLRKSRKIKK